MAEIERKKYPKIDLGDILLEAEEDGGKSLE